MTGSDHSGSVGNAIVNTMPILKWVATVAGIVIGSVLVNIISGMSLAVSEMKTRSEVTSTQMSYMASQLSKLEKSIEQQYTAAQARADQQLIQRDIQAVSQRVDMIDRRTGGERTRQ